MDSDNFEVKCAKCGWVHVAIPLERAAEYASNPEDLKRYFSCFHCGAPNSEFVLAQGGDAPVGCTLQAVVVEGNMPRSTDRP